MAVPHGREEMEVQIGCVAFHREPLSDPGGALRPYFLLFEARNPRRAPSTFASLTDFISWTLVSKSLLVVIQQHLAGPGTLRSILHHLYNLLLKVRREKDPLSFD